MRRPCLVCRVLTDNGSYCPTHEPVKPPSPSSLAWREPGAAKVRQQVLDRDHHRCTVCASTEQLRVDHIVPASEGGATEPWNLHVLCEHHHQEKHRWAARQAHQG